MAAVGVLGRANADQSVVAPYRTEAQRLAYQQVRAGAHKPLPWVATAGFALQDGNQELFRATTKRLLERFPNNPQAHYYSGVQSLEDGDWRSAEKSLLKAKELGLPEESVAEMLRLAINRQRWVWQYAVIIAAVTAAWLIGLACLYLLGAWLSRATYQAAQRDDPMAKNTSERWLRWLYRRVIDCAGFYYYLSLPLLLVVSIALPLALGYAALMLPYLNLWIVALVLIGGAAGVVTAISGIRTASFVFPTKSLEDDSSMAKLLASGS